MSLKNALLASAAWMIVVMTISGVLIWYIVSNPVSGATAEQRSQMLGSGMGIIAVIGFAAIWLPLASKMGQERRKAAKLASRDKSNKS